jgi:hypothetical protein
MTLCVCVCVCVCVRACILFSDRFCMSRTLFKIAMPGDYKLCERFLPINLCNRSHHL